MISLITALILFIIAAVAYAIKDLQSHFKFKWEGKHTSFWGNNSWMRKYNYTEDMYRTPLPDNWYYNTFKIEYKERFPGSATIFVFMTDGWHLMQFVFLNSLLLGFAVLTIHPIIWFIVFRAIWAIVFNISYRVFSKQQ